MEIIGTDMYDKKQGKKKTMIIISIIIVILLIISIVLFVVISMLKSKQFKFVVDSKKISSYSNDMFIFEGNNIYISLKDVAPLIGYEYFTGGYKQYNQDKDQCYMQCKEEVTTLEKNSNKIYKTPTDIVDYTYFNIKEPARRSEDKIYIELDDLGLACNLNVSFNNETNQVTINTLDYLAELYNSKYAYAAVKTFENKKAILYGLLVVQNVENTDKDVDESKIRYGFNNLDNEEIVGKKYTDIKFIEGTEEFILKTEENKVGIIEKEGKTRVAFSYDSLKQIDKDRNLYLAVNGEKKGVLDKEGKILLFLEYSEIGIDLDKFASTDIKNKYILFNKLLPVKQNSKWGLFDVDKREIVLPIEFDVLGCSLNNNNTDNTMGNVLIIPEISCIVVGKYPNENEKSKYIYGIYTSEGKEKIMMGLDSVYAVISSGHTSYKMIYGGQIYDIIEVLNQVPQENVNSTPEQAEVNNNNTKVNEVMVNDIQNNMVNSVMVNETIYNYNNNNTMVNEVNNYVQIDAYTQNIIGY